MRRAILLLVFLMSAATLALQFVPMTLQPLPNGSGICMR